MLQRHFRALDLPVAGVLAKVDLVTARAESTASESLRLQIDGMTCASCSSRIERVLLGIE